MKVTIQQIAKEANVSTATVSRVIHSPHLVKEKNRKKIQAIISKYQYSYISPISNDKRNKRYIGLMIPEISNSFFAKIVDSFVTIFYKEFSNYELLFYYSSNDPEREFKGLEFFSLQKCEVIIVIPTSNPIHNPDIWNNISIPIIWVERCWDSIVAKYAILSNKEAAAYEATITLIENRAKNILLINGPDNLSSAIDRTKGFIKAIEEKNLQNNSHKISYGKFSWKHGYVSIKNEDMSLYDGIISGSGVITLGIIQALYEKNISIPKDISFISFDETADFNLTDVSTIFFSGEEMASELALLLKKVLNNNIDKYNYYLHAHKILRGSEKNTTKS